MSGRLSLLVVAAAILINAAVQALLILPNPTPGLAPGFILGALVSALAWLAVYALVVARAVSAGDSDEWQVLRRHGPRFAAWIVTLAVVTVIGLLPFEGIPGYLVLAVTPYLPLAAMSGASNPLVANLQTIRRRPLALIWRLAAFGLLGAVVVVLMALNAFFVGGMAASFVNSLAMGGLIWLITTSFASAWRRAGPAGAE